MHCSYCQLGLENDPTPVWCQKKTTKKPTKKSPEKANETDDIPTNTTKGPEPDEDDRIADDLDREEQEAGDDEEDDDDELNKEFLTDLEEI